MGLWVLILGFPATAADLPEDKTKAVILAYHRVGEDHIPDQNLTLDQFLAHVQEMKNGNYNVLPLSEIIDAIQTDAELPERTIAITFEGAYRSAIQNAAPLLIENNIPFTVFYAAGPLDQNDAVYASWAELKNLDKKVDVEIETLPAIYTHTAHLSQKGMLKNINRARQRHREEFNREATFLAYPFGEYSAQLQELAKTQGYRAAFGLHSGAIHASADIYTLPRFSMTESYGDLERFRLVTNAYPLPINDLEPSDPYLQENDFFTGFTLNEALTPQSDQLSCFISGGGKADIETLGPRIEIRSNTLPTDQTRIRLNCTMPGPISEDDEQKWRWLGLLYHRSNIPQQDEPPAPRE